MRYLLKNKDMAVLGFDTIIKDGFVYIDSVKLIEPSLLPFAGNNLKESLFEWVNKRKIPKHRQYAKDILNALGKDGKNNFMAYIDVSFGLSLNDSYWVVPSGSNLKWSDYNLYDNQFDAALELAAFGLKNSGASSTSPEYTTNGMLKKCWHRDGEGAIWLYKGSWQGNEAFSEFYCHQVAKAMGLGSIFYDLIEKNGEILSACPIFTNQNVGYIPISELINTAEKNDYKGVLEGICGEIYGKEAFEDLMVFDAIIGNTDRHLGNFGMLVDNDTRKIISPAPIFDNGLSLLGQGDFLHSLATIDKVTTYFEMSLDEQLDKYIRARHTEMLKKLTNFSIQKHEKYNLDGDWLDGFESLIRSRARLGLKCCAEAK